MKRTTILLATLILSTSACGDKPGGTRAAEAEAAKKPTSALPAAPVIPSVEASSESVSHIAGAGVTLEGAAVTISLDVHKDHRVSGSFATGTTKMAVHGFVDDTVLRLWMVSESAGDSVWRGTLMAEGTLPDYTGTFAMSDSGAASTVEGSWKTAK